MCDALDSTIALPIYILLIACVTGLLTVMLLVDNCIPGSHMLVIATGSAAVTDLSPILCVARDSAVFVLLPLHHYFSDGKSIKGFVFPSGSLECSN